MKTIKINTCKDCPHSRSNWFGRGIICNATYGHEEIMYNADRIPDWCPLENVNE